jgi:hypothetical protein
MAHPSPNGPSAIERFDAQAQPWHPLIDDFILDAAPLIGEGGFDGLCGDQNGHSTLPGQAPLAHRCWGTFGAPKQPKAPFSRKCQSEKVILYLSTQVFEVTVGSEFGFTSHSCR